MDKIDIYIHNINTFITPYKLYKLYFVFQVIQELNIIIIIIIHEVYMLQNYISLTNGVINTNKMETQGCGISRHLDGKTRLQYSRL